MTLILKSAFESCELGRTKILIQQIDLLYHGRAERGIQPKSPPFELREVFQIPLMSLDDFGIVASSLHRHPIACFPDLEPPFHISVFPPAPGHIFSPQPLLEGLQERNRVLYDVRFGKTLKRHLSLIKNQLQNVQGKSVVANRPLLVVHLVESVPKAQQHILHCLRIDNLLYVLRMRMIPVQQSGVVDIKIYQLLL